MMRISEYTAQKVATWKNARRGLIMIATKMNRILPHYLPAAIPNDEVLKSLKTWLAEQAKAEVQQKLRKITSEKRRELKSKDKMKNVTRKRNPKVTFIGGTCDVR